ncbi:MAG: TIGR04282 family arsenosugar biosynthesis glycosyltransferase [Dehalococcoidia bacterium]
MFDTCVIVMAKQPDPLQAKTRLAAAIGTNAAGALAAAFFDDTIDLVRRVPGATLLLAFAPPTARPWFERLLCADDMLQVQPDGNLGVRLSAAFASAFSAGARRAVVIATDSPSLPPAFIEDAFDALLNRDVVIGPADDGGYCLIGMTRHLPVLFERIDWSTERVFAQTLDRARELNASPALLPAWYDVDDARGLEQLRADLQVAGAGRPATRRVLNDLQELVPGGSAGRLARDSISV